MSAGQFVGRVGTIAAAMGIGVAILHGTAVASADTDAADVSARTSSSAGTQHDSATSQRGAAQATADRRAAATAPASPARGRNALVNPRLEVSIPDTSVVNGPSDSGSGIAARVFDPVSPVALPTAATAPAVATATLPAPAANVAPNAAANASVANAAANASVANAAANASVAIAPDPNATTPTSYGTLGKWMINKSGQVADWIGIPYCGEGSTVGSCSKPPGKTMQEPINTIFVVKAPNKYFAEVQLDFALRVSGFGPSCCSSIGYSAIVGDQTDPQFPRGGPLGLGILPPMPFGLFQKGLLGLAAGLGPAYRDLPFFLANTHLRTFGGYSDGNGNYIFTASVSKENLDASGGGLLPTHGFESYDEARTKLLDNMLGTKWLIGSSNLGLVAMDNMISADNPDYTTGDHDGFAQVIGLAGLFGASPAQRASSVASVRSARSVAAA